MYEECVSNLLNNKMTTERTQRKLLSSVCKNYNLLYMNRFKKCKSSLLALKIQERVFGPSFGCQCCSNIQRSASVINVMVLCLVVSYVFISTPSCVLSVSSVFFPVFLSSLLRVCLPLSVSTVSPNTFSSVLPLRYLTGCSSSHR